MGKLVLIPKNEQEINNKIDYYILGLKDFSINMPKYWTIEEIKEIVKKGKKVFVSVNKNIHNDELELLKENLLKLNQTKIEGLIFYDLAIPNFKDQLKYPLIWNQEHLTNNFATINYWYNKGIKTTYLSSEITKREILEIKQNTKSQLMMNIFGYIPIFTSKRPLVNNYLETFNIKNNKTVHKINKENKDYYITSDNGTTVYSAYILNAIEEYQQLKNIVDYFVINSFMIDNIEEVIDMYLHNNITIKTETGFLYQETIYKVK